MKRCMSFTCMVMRITRMVAAPMLVAQPRWRSVETWRGKKKGEYIPGRYIVTLRDDADPDAVARDNGAAPEHKYRRVMKGFGGTMSDAVRAKLERDPRVVRIEQDAVVTAQQVSTTSWGLDRVDQRSLPLNN